MPEPPLPGNVENILAKKAQFDAITKKREEVLKAEKERVEKRVEDEKAHEVMATQAFAEETAEAKERSEGREEWRQGEHQKKRDAEAQKLKVAAAKLGEEEKAKKKAAEQKKRDDLMLQLHERAIEKRIVAKKKALDLEEEHQVTAADHFEERTVSSLGDETKRGTEHFDNDCKRKIQQLELNATRRSQEIDDEAMAQRKEAEREQSAAESEAKRNGGRTDIAMEISKSRTELAQKKSHIERMRKRLHMTLDEQLQKDRADVIIEIDRMKAEFLVQSQNKKMIIQSQVERRRKDAAARHRNAEDQLS